jgi:predicted nuclease with TOPRIM domain
MKKWQLYLLVAVVILVVGLIFGWKIAGILGLFGGGLAKKEADKVKEKQKDLQKQADDIQKKSDKRKEKADKLATEGEDREKEAEKINDKLKDTDDSFKNMFNVFLILFLSFSLCQNYISNIRRIETMNTSIDSIVDFGNNRCSTDY